MAVQVRKTVTVLFADVVGSTSLAETTDPERVRAALAQYFAAMRDVVEQHGGTVEKFIGDAIMAVFGIRMSTRTTLSVRFGRPRACGSGSGHSSCRCRSRRGSA
jgi:class 3 adenylate cyclase